MTYSFYRIINEKKYFLMDFSINENNPNNNKDIKKIDDIFSMLPHIEKSAYLVDVELNDIIETSIFLIDENSFKELFTKINDMYVEEFFYRLNAKEEYFLDKIE